MKQKRIDKILSPENKILPLGFVKTFLESRISMMPENFSQVLQTNSSDVSPASWEHICPGVTASYVVEIIYSVDFVYFCVMSRNGYLSRA